MDLQFVVDAAHVKVDRVDGHAQFRGSGLVVVAVDEQLEQPRLVRRQMIVGALGRTNFAEERNHAARDFRRHRSTTRHDFPEALEQARRGRVLQQVAARPGAHGIENSLVVVIDRQHQHQQIGKPLLQIPHSVDATHTWQTDVRENDVGDGARNFFERFLHRPIPTGACVARSAVHQ